MLKLVSPESKLNFDDVLIVPQRTTTSSRKNIKLHREFKFYHSNKMWDGFPFMVANMGCTGTLEMCKISGVEYNAITCLHKHQNKKDVIEFFNDQPAWKDSFSWYSIGMDNKELLDISKKISGPKFFGICIDIANGYSDKFVKHCADTRKLFPDSIIMAGNVCTPEMVQELIISGGVDIVKVGIGPGSACTTRIQTGVGYPQLSAIAECASAAHGLTNGDRRIGLICADGGCRTSGDVCKAYCAGADFVMSGGMFAGTDECEGEWDYKPQSGLKYWYYDKTPTIPHGVIWEEGFQPFDIDTNEPHRSQITYNSDLDKQIIEPAIKRSFKFYGMSSHHAQEKHNGGTRDYRGSEGRVVTVPYKGSAADVFEEIQAGIRSCASYIGATSIKDMNKCAKFVRISNGNTHNRIFEK